MCPRCGANKVKYLQRSIGIIEGTSFMLTKTEGPAETTVIICDQCSYLIYDEKYGWAEEILAAQEHILQLAKEQDVCPTGSFLSQMGVPHCFQEGGVYYVRAGSNDPNAEV